MKPDDGDCNQCIIGGPTWPVAPIFFTVNLAERKRRLLVENVDTLRTVVKKVKAKHPFHIDAMVILPDHLHALWTLPNNRGQTTIE